MGSQTCKKSLFIASTVLARNQDIYGEHMDSTWIAGLGLWRARLELWRACGEHVDSMDVT